jgi:hypothetical protein
VFNHAPLIFLRGIEILTGPHKLSELSVCKFTCPTRVDGQSLNRGEEISVVCLGFGLVVVGPTSCQGIYGGGGGGGGGLNEVP